MKRFGSPLFESALLWRQRVSHGLLIAFLLPLLLPQMKEDRFRKLFAAFGTLTDCCLKFTKDGKFRKFGFIGYKSEDEAQAALNHFNRSFIDTSRITVS